MAMPRGYDPRTYHGHPAGPGSGAPGAPPAAVKPDPGANFLRALAAAAGPEVAPKDYGAAFQSSLDQARGNISQQLQAALSDIQMSQQKAGEALSQYAPMVNSDWQANNEVIGGAANSINAANAKAGVHTLMDPSMILAPDKALTAATHRQDLSDQALLNTGIGQAAAHDTSLANLAAIQAQGGLDQAAMQFQQQQALQAQDAANQANRDRQQFAYGLIGQQQAANLSKADTAAAALDQPATTDSKIAESYTRNGVDNATANKVHADPKYARFTELINDPTSNPFMVANLLKKYPKLFAVLKAENPDYFAPTSIAAATEAAAAANSPGNGGFLTTAGNALQAVQTLGHHYDRRTGLLTR